MSMKCRLFSANWHNKHLSRATFASAFNQTGLGGVESEYGPFFLFVGNQTHGLTCAFDIRRIETCDARRRVVGVVNKAVEIIGAGIRERLQYENVNNGVEMR